MMICGNALYELRKLESESIDIVVTDPPYGYSFMNKDWDKAVIGVETWRECLRVLKPGSFAAIMSSPRQDVLARMIVNLQTAGFRTDFTSIYWTYACLSEDTEVLTQDGWERFNKSNRFINKSILCYDVINDRYFYEQPESWHYYDVREYMYRIRSDETDQLVSRNHRIFTQKGFIQAEKLQEQESIAYLSELPKGILHLSSVVKNRESWSLLFHKLQTESKHQEISSSQWKTLSFYDRQKKTRTKRIDDGREESGLEGWSNLLQNSWQLQRGQVYPMSEGISFNVKERWLCDGTQNTGGSTNWKTIIEDRGSSSYRSQSSKQFIEQLDAFYEQPTSQEIRTFSRSYNTTVATVTREYYEGLIFCPTISSGCFVARRNGKIFLTGNSGFPKAANISKLVDKRNGLSRDWINVAQYLKEQRLKNNVSLDKINQAVNGKLKAQHYESVNQEFNRIPIKADYLILKQILDLDNRFDELIEREEAEREIIGKGTAGLGKKPPWDVGGYQSDYNLTKSVTEKAKELDGSYTGFQPKPAVEVILIVMKPLSEKTYVDQALANGKGITWLDSVRIPFQDDDDPGIRTDYTNLGIPHAQKDGGRPWINERIDKGLPVKEYEPNNKGRFPANLLVSDSALGIEYSRYFDLDKWFSTTFPFIITPKASSTEKNKGLDKWIVEEEEGEKDKKQEEFRYTKLVRKIEPNKEDISSYLKQWRERKGLSQKDVAKYFPSVTGGLTGCIWNWENDTNIPTREEWLKLKEILGFDDTYDKIMTEYVEDSLSKWGGMKHGTQHYYHGLQNNHPTVKPIKLISWLITLLSREGDIILDPFCGSGTTLLAAKMLNRKYIGIDINQEYIDITKKRLL